MTQELDSLKNRVRHFIGARHWVSDGESKESALRAVLRRHLPLTTGVGRGFVITNKGPSTQIDILLFDRTKPLLYHDGDFVITTPDACQGMIEVKTRLTPKKLGEAIQKLVKCGEEGKGSVPESRCYEDTGFQTLANPVSSKCFTFAVAKSVTPKDWRQRAMRRS